MSEYPPVYSPPNYGFANPSSSSSEEMNKGSAFPNQFQPQKVHSTIPPPIPPVIVQDLNSVPNYMAWSILNILCCFWILGCVACFFSIQTDDSKKNGDIQGALNNSRTARIINIVSTILGLILNIIVIILFNTHAF